MRAADDRGRRQAHVAAEGDDVLPTVPRTSTSPPKATTVPVTVPSMVTSPPTATTVSDALAGGHGHVLAELDDRVSRRAAVDGGVGDGGRLRAGRAGGAGQDQAEHDQQPAASTTSASDGRRILSHSFESSSLHLHDHGGQFDSVCGPAVAGRRRGRRGGIRPADGAAPSTAAGGAAGARRLRRRERSRRRRRGGAHRRRERRAAARWPAARSRRRRAARRRRRGAAALQAPRRTAARPSARTPSPSRSGRAGRRRTTRMPAGMPRSPSQSGGCQPAGRTSSRCRRARWPRPASAKHQNERPGQRHEQRRTRRSPKASLASRYRRSFQVAALPKWALSLPQTPFARLPGARRRRHVGAQQVLRLHPLEGAEQPPGAGHDEQDRDADPDDHEAEAHREPDRRGR